MNTQKQNQPKAELVAEETPPPWRLIQSKPVAEARIVEALKLYGVAAFAPMETVWRHSPGRKFQVKRPLIRGYVFARFTDAQQHLVHEIDGAVRLVAFDGVPAKVPARFVEAMQAAEAAGDFDSTKSAPRRPPRLAKGAAVRITEGHYTGLVATIVKLKGERRVRVMLAQCGANQEVVIGIDKLEDAEDDARAAA